MIWKTSLKNTGTTNLHDHFFPFSLWSFWLEDYQRVFDTKDFFRYQTRKLQTSLFFCLFFLQKLEHQNISVMILSNSNDLWNNDTKNIWSCSSTTSNTFQMHKTWTEQCLLPYIWREWKMPDHFNNGIRTINFICIFQPF